SCSGWPAPSRASSIPCGCAAGAPPRAENPAGSEPALEQAVRLALQPLAMVGVDDRDEPSRTLADRLGAQLGGAEFGHDNIDIRPRRRDAAREPADDPPAAAAHGGREGKDGVSTRRALPDAHVVGLATDAAEIFLHRMLGADLAGEVDLD